MNQLLGLAEALGTKGHAGINHIEREVIRTIEHDEIDLPSDVIQADGTLDLYKDVQSYFEIQYKRKRQRFILRNNGWVGHIPLNDRYTLEIETRVPVANLERIIDRAPTDKITLFSQYTHAYLSVDDRPKSLFDILTDRFLFALGEVRNAGLHKQYLQRERVSGSPAGRLNPFQTVIRTKATGIPTAVYSTFERTADVGANRLLRSAIERLIGYYLPLEDAGSGARLDKLIDASEHFTEIKTASSSEAMPSSIARYARSLPEHRSAYFDALRLAGYIVTEQGMAIRGSGGLVLAPATVVDFAAIFESYARAILLQEFAATGVQVLDGNVGGAGGAKESLFTELALQASNPPMKPDIVLKRDGESALIIDVKYKPPQQLPERSETDQLVCYATRYGCQRAMVLYPAFPEGRNSPVELVGTIGQIQLLRGVLDVGAQNLELIEKNFAGAVLASIN